MFRSDRGIIEPSRHRMSQFNLAFFVGEQKSFRSLQHAKPAALKTRGVLATPNSFATRFDADHPHMSILQKRMEQTEGVATAADAGDEQIGQAFLALANLAARFTAT